MSFGQYIYGVCVRTTYRITQEWGLRSTDKLLLWRYVFIRFQIQSTEYRPHVKHVIVALKTRLEPSQADHT
jgi:hypothetical protein